MPEWGVGSCAAGSQKFIPGDQIPYTLGSDAAVAGDAMAISASSGDLVLADGTNGFAGILETQTQAGAPDRPGNREAHGIGSGSEVNLGVRGVRVANLAAGVVPGNALAPSGTAGELGIVDDGTGAATPAGPGDMMALTAPNADGFGVIRQ